MLKRKVKLTSESGVRPGHVNPQFEKFIEREGFQLPDVAHALDDLQMNTEMYVEELEKRFKKGEISKREFEGAADALGRIDQHAYQCQVEIEKLTDKIKRNPKLNY